MSTADGPDMGQLLESEQAALQTYMTVTGQEPEAAVALLRRSQWNVQVSNFHYRDSNVISRVDAEDRAPSRLPSPSSSTVKDRIQSKKPVLL